MSLLTILEYPDLRLRKRANAITEVNDALRRTIDDMFETTREPQAHLMPESKWQAKAHFTNETHATATRQQPIQDASTQRATEPHSSTTNREEEQEQERFSGEMPEVAEEMREPSQHGLEPESATTNRTSTRERRLSDHLQDTSHMNQ
jgi:hypothetical protein